MMPAQSIGEPALWLPTSEMTTVQAAQLYASHGFRVVPVWGVQDRGGVVACQCGKHECPAVGKHPIPKAWQKAATRDENGVVDLFAGKSRANVGIVVDDGYLLLDIDGDEGRISLAQLEAKHGALPETMTSSSGRGEHRLFRLASEQDPKRLTNQSKLFPGLDVRARNGQFVAAPSMHRSGKRYTWTRRVMPAELPDWLYLALQPKAPPPRQPPPPPRSRVVPIDSSAAQRYAQKVVDNAARDIACAGTGQRNDTLFKRSAMAFGYVVGEGLSMAEAEDTFVRAGISAGLSPSEAQATVASARANGEKTPRYAADNPNFGQRERSRPQATGTYAAPPPAPESEPMPDDDESDGTPPTGGGGDDGSGGWQRELSVDDDGRVRKTYGNVCKILRHTAGWSLAYNEMRLTPELNGAPLTDADIGHMREKVLERVWRLDVGKDLVADAVVQVSSENAYHPLRDYLIALEWDGKPYIDRLASCILGITDPSALVQAMLRRWCISAVARALRPGCKVDTVLVLFGKQGAKKSGFFRVLAGDWFGESAMNLRDKDSVLQLYSAWIYEWPEIDRVTLSGQASVVKGFLTQATDGIRPPYMRAIATQKRHTVIVGSTNIEQYLDDHTGSRRFHTVVVPGRVNVELLAEWRDQVWAEAVAALYAGEQWWLTDAEDAALATAAEDHTAQDPWEETVSVWFARQKAINRKDVKASVNALLEDELKLPASARTKKAQMQVADILRKLGFMKHRSGGKTTWEWKECAT